MQQLCLFSNQTEDQAQLTQTDTLEQSEDGFKWIPQQW